MVQEHAPVLRFSSGERAFPAPVEPFIGRSSLVDLSGTVITARPTIEDMEAAGPLAFLDYEPGDVIASYEEDRANIAPTVYGRVASASDSIVLQYWMFYFFNDGRLNDHEGDWELVQVMLSPDGARAEGVLLSQHHSASLVRWSSLDEVAGGTHLVIWVSLGSHANYLPDAQMLMHGDSADGGGEEWMPEEYELVPIGTGDRGDEPAWLRYEGAWGAPAGPMGRLLGLEGPQGPMFRENGRLWSGPTT